MEYLIPLVVVTGLVYSVCPCIINWTLKLYTGITRYLSYIVIPVQRTRVIHRYGGGYYYGEKKRVYASKVNSR